MVVHKQSERRAELIGYTDRPSVMPGDRISFMISSEFPEFEAQLVRLIHGDNNLAGPGWKDEIIDSPVNKQWSGQRQETHVGSHIEVPKHRVLTGLRSFTVQAWIKPSVPSLGRDQGVISTGTAGFTLGVDANGLPFAEVGHLACRERVTGTHALRAGTWYFLAASFDATSRRLSLVANGAPIWPLEDSSQTVDLILPSAAESGGGDGLLIAAVAQHLSPNGRTATTGHWNGRIERPRLYGRALASSELERLETGASAKTIDGLVGEWDFAADFSSARVRDRSGTRLHGRCVNYPTRALLGHAWDRETYDFRENPDAYCAIEFHDDDIEDCGWEPTIDLTVPDDLRSGIYALCLRAAGAEDHIPFFVRPKRGKATADIAYLIPTVSYQAYANESVLNSSQDTDWSIMTDIKVVPDLYDVFVWEHPELGLSIYDLHADKSGINYSSWKRPILNMRPTHRFWVTAAPRHFAAELYVTDWFEAMGHGYDVITDHDLHEEGVDLLSRYKVVVTGSHPEYWTTPMMDALETYQASGGRLVYLGGNGFYWVTAIDPERPHIVEVRRGYSSSRVWNSHAAEVHLASTGEKGGIWRFRGRNPNQITGVGFAAQGWNTDTPGFTRLPDSYDPRAAFIFEGVDDEVIGNFGLVMNGAAGDEVDRMDHVLGTPVHAMRLATSQGNHSKYYMVTHEDVLVTHPQLDGTNNPNVRADMCYFEGPNGGAVFSVPAISASGSLSHDNYRNNLSRILDNVIRHFVK
jgi:N,N-dimethylformamidase